jgi:hypothetical protein
MNRLRFPASLILLVFALSCSREQDRSADGASDGDRAPSASIEAKAEDGKVSINTPGFKLKVDLPRDGSAGAITSGSDIIYPGSSVRGMSVDANAESGASRGQVAIRFTSPDAVDRILAWYRDPVRTRDFSVTDTAREGEGYRIEGTAGDGHFRVGLVPAANGGATGELTLSDGS